MSIKTLSPYLITIPLVNPVTSVVCQSFTVKLYVWNGERAAVPSEPVYVITKINAAGSSGNDRIDISKLINDDFEFGFEPQTSTVIVNGNNQLWVKYECFYDDLPEVAAIIDVSLAVKGYGYTMQGANPQLPSNGILLTGTDFKVSRTGFFVLPFLAEETPIDDRIITIDLFDRKTGVIYDLEVSANFTYSNLTVYVRSVGQTEWTATTAPNYSVPIDIASNIFEVMVTAIDVPTGDLITSGIYTIIPLKIYKVVPSSGGMAITIYYDINIFAITWTLQILNYATPGVWSNVTSSTNNPLYIEFTPTGNYAIRIITNGITSNEVYFTIPLTAEINIP